MSAKEIPTYTLTFDLPYKMVTFSRTDSFPNTLTALMALLPEHAVWEMIEQIALHIGYWRCDGTVFVPCLLAVSGQEGESFYYLMYSMEKKLHTFEFGDESEARERMPPVDGAEWVTCAEFAAGKFRQLYKRWEGEPVSKGDLPSVVYGDTLGGETRPWSVLFADVQGCKDREDSEDLVFVYTFTDNSRAILKPEGVEVQKPLSRLKPPTPQERDQMIRAVTAEQLGELDADGLSHA